MPRIPRNIKPPLQGILQKLGDPMSILKGNPEVVNRFDAAMGTTGIPPSMRELSAKRFLQPGMGPPQPVMTPAPMQAPMIPSMFQQSLAASPEPVMGPEVGQFINPERGVYNPPVKFKGTKAQAPTKAQLKVLVERLLGRQVAPTERLQGDERLKAMKEILGSGMAPTPVPFTNLLDTGRSPVTGMPVTNTPGGRALRLPVEDARVIALQNPERFKPGGFTNFGAGSLREAVEVPPGAPEDIIGGIGLQKKVFEPLYTSSMKQAIEHLGKAETKAAGYALPKPANVVIATAQGFKLFNKLLRKGTVLGRQWDEIYQNALDAKPHVVGTLSPQEYFVEVYQKMTMARPKFQSRFKEEFKFIGELGEQVRKIIAPEAQLAERVKTPMAIPEEGAKTSFQKTQLESAGQELTGPGIEAQGRVNELEKSRQNSKTFKKFLDGLVKESVKNKRTLTPMEIRVKWAEFLDSFKKDLKSVKGALPPLTLGGIGYGMGSE